MQHKIVASLKNKVTERKKKIKQAQISEGLQIKSLLHSKTSVINQPLHSVRVAFSKLSDLICIWQINIDWSRLRSYYC